MIDHYPNACSGSGDLQKLRAICDKYSILIFDEVINGFGRLSQPFAAQYFDAMLDMMTRAEGLKKVRFPWAAHSLPEKFSITLR